VIVIPLIQNCDVVNFPYFILRESKINISVA